MRKKILKAILFSVFFSMAILGLLQYFYEIGFAQEQIVNQSELTLKMINPTAQTGISGANIMILKEEAANSLYSSNQNLLYLRMKGLSDTTPKSDFSDEIPPQNIEHIFSSKSISPEELAIINNIPLDDFVSDVKASMGRVYIKQKLNVKNGGYIYAVFKAENLKFLWLRSLGKTLALLLVILGIAGRYAWVESAKLEKNFINRDALAAISGRLREASHQVGDFSKTVIHSAHKLESSFSSQGAAIEQMTQTLQTIHSQIAQNLESANESYTFSKKMLNDTQEGNKSVQGMLDGMKTIEVSNNKIFGLVELISNIDSKSKVIDDITFQTKLLSFNASVEAARAGEAGKGFAVVAEEMSILSGVTASSSKEIAEIVEETRSEAEKIAEENAQKVTQGMSLSNNTAVAFESIASDTKKILENGQSILNASKNQSTDLGQVNTSMLEINKLTQDNSTQVKDNSQLGKQLEEHSLVIGRLVDDLYSLLGDDSIANEQSLEKEDVDYENS
ncbi:MAG: hypothetical protein HON90_18115 [Halobacteriovoraceae bacterium]|nr:hypothetical protein [Halobacteriovoraceae bacterium]